jgi:hypothetical protein
MEELKTIVITIDDIFDIYTACTDKNKYVMNHMQKYFINKCYHGSLVTGVNKVLKISPCEVHGGYADGRCYMFAEVEVTCIVYKPGDIIVGAKFVKIYGIFQSVTDTMNISLISLKSINMPNEIIANVRLDNIDYNQLDKVCATANIFTCRTSDLRYNIGIPKKLLKSEIEQLEDLRKKIADEIKRRKTVNKKMLDIFELYYYSSTVQPGSHEVAGWSGASITKPGLIDIMDIKLDSIKPGVYKRSADIALSCPEIYLESSAQSSIEAITAYVALYDMFYDIYKNIRAINDMAELYTEEMIVANKSIWKYVTDTRLNIKDK